MIDVSKRLANWRDQPPERWLSAGNRYLPPGAKAVLVIAIACQLASLTWTFVPGSTPVAALPSRQVLQVAQSLGESTQANVTVLRDGVPQVIVIDTIQLQRLRENRE